MTTHPQPAGPATASEQSVHGGSTAPRETRQYARLCIRLEGIVQGVGFRPFVHRLAGELGLAGFAGNDTRGVFVEVEGEPGTLARFREALESQAPPLSLIERVTTSAMPPTGEVGFAIRASVDGSERRALVSPDSATCADCLHEMDDPTDRRHGYPFTNCTNCGPRFTIIHDVPYDRPNTTMAGFALCANCTREYHDPDDRRYHAQPVCCPACGPRLALVDPRGSDTGGTPATSPLAAAAAALLDGTVVAVKGLGGYHLAASATDERAVAALRARKHREDKPFALMVSGVDQARRLCAVGAAEAELLSAPRRPIVLLTRRAGAPVAASVAPGNRELGVMLPYTPLHELLLRETGEPIVLTSGNVSDEPIAYRDGDARERLAGIADFFLVHDRDIHMRTDDSVTRAFRGYELPVRRSRGYVPHPVALPDALPRPVLACGAELKNTFCLARGTHAFVSHHIGDLENYETLRSFTEGIEHFTRLFDISPDVVAHDLHPEYLSTKYALDLDGPDLVGVQHHHAHVASCLADNGETGPAIGVAFDGLGYGSDGTLWGGEFLITDLSGFERAAFLDPVPMPGGAAAVREPWRMAAAYLDAACGGAPPGGLAVARRNAARWEHVLAAARGGVNAPLTSSAGRLFDAVAALLDVRDTITYEGQAAIELEQRAEVAERGTYAAGVVTDDAGTLRLRSVDLICACLEDLAGGVEPSTIAARFHNGLAAAAVRICGLVQERTGHTDVALSGGVFQNQLLLELVVAGLAEQGFRVLVHRQVPPNDGGISLGQAAVAGARANSSRDEVGAR